MRLYKLTDKTVINLDFLVAVEWVELRDGAGKPAKALSVMLAASAPGEPLTYYVTSERGHRLLASLAMEMED